MQNYHGYGLCLAENANCVIMDWTRGMAQSG